MDGCQTCYQLRGALASVIDRVDGINHRVTYALARSAAGLNSDSECLQMLLEEVKDARDLVETARSVFDTHLKFHES